MKPPEQEDRNATLDTALTLANGVPVYALSALERAALHTVYDLYEQLLGQPQPGLTPASLQNARPHLGEAYGQVQKRGRLKALRGRILASTISCPYCGFGEVSELDHYLPRIHYGELAINEQNLIPSCSPCNNAKRTNVPGMAQAYGPGLIHPYYQVLPERDFLRAMTGFVNGTLEVAFDIDPNDIDPELVSKLQFQLERLKLNERYPQQINKYLSEQRYALLKAREGGSEALSEFLSASLASLMSSFGRNDWRVALLRSLSNNKDFCDHPEFYLG